MDNIRESSSLSWRTYRSVLEFGRQGSLKNYCFLRRASSSLVTATFVHMVELADTPDLGSGIEDRYVKWLKQAVCKTVTLETL